MGVNYSQTIFRSDTDVFIADCYQTPRIMEYSDNIIKGGDVIKEAVLRLGSNGTLIHEIYKENFNNYYFNNYKSFTLRIDRENTAYIEEYDLLLMDFDDMIDLIKNMNEPYFITLIPLEKIN